MDDVSGFPALSRMHVSSGSKRRHGVAKVPCQPCSTRTGMIGAASSGSAAVTLLDEAGATERRESSCCTRARRLCVDTRSDCVALNDVWCLRTERRNAKTRRYPCAAMPVCGMSSVKWYAVEVGDKQWKSREGRGTHRSLPDGLHRHTGCEGSQIGDHDALRWTKPCAAMRSRTCWWVVARSKASW